METRRCYFFTMLFLFVNFLGAAVAQTAPATEPQSVPNECEQFKAIVVKPDRTIDYKLRVTKPSEAIDYKGIVINPCDKKLLVKIKPLPVKPLPHKTGQSPARGNQNQFTAGLKPITEILTASEMLKRARLAKEQKEKEGK